MIVAVDEARHDRHPLGVEDLCPLADQALDVAVVPTAMKRPPLTAKA